MIYEFTKMQGAGNDYIYFNCIEKEIKDPEKLSIALSDRHFGIGGDGIVLILKSEKADYKMRMFNADGSEGKMCGNAIRCVAKYLYDNGTHKKDKVMIETLGGIKSIQLDITNGEANFATVDMGKAVLKCSDIPVFSNKETFINRPLKIDGKEYGVTCVSMGNPHAVIFTDDVDSLDLKEIGPKFEFNPLFPERVNTEFVKITREKSIKMRVWERGSGETLACGTGACASVVACVLNGYFRHGEEIEVELIGGVLKITYLENGSVIMKGPAVKVFEGKIII